VQWFAAAHLIPRTSDLGFQLVEVPAGPLADRVALVQDTIGQLRR
jgi:predicted ATPase